MSTSMTTRPVPPVRLRLLRKKGNRLQAESLRANGLAAVKVTRPSPFGNPFAVVVALHAGRAHDAQAARDLVVVWFRDWLEGGRLGLAAAHLELEARRIL